MSESGPKRPSLPDITEDATPARQLIGGAKAMAGVLIFKFFEGANPPVEDLQGIAIATAVSGLKISSVLLMVNGLFEGCTGKRHTLLPKSVDRLKEKEENKK